VFEVLAQLVGRERSLPEAVAAPRFHTEGDLNLLAEAKWPEADLAYLRKAGYTIKAGGAAVLNAVSYDPSSGNCFSASR